MYHIMYNLSSNGIGQFKWISYVKSVFEECGLNFIWEGQNSENGKVLKEQIRQILKDQFYQKWHDDIVNSSRGEFYSIFKSEFGLEKYLINYPGETELIFVKLELQI